MNKRTTSIVVTLVTVLLCGCPGLCGLCFGAMFALVSFIPNADININGKNDPQTALTLGVVSMLIGVVFVVIPIIVAFIMLRKKKTTPTVNISEPIPPAI